MAARIIASPKTWQGEGEGLKMRAFRVFGRSIVDFYDEMFLLVGINIVWTFLSAIVSIIILLPLSFILSLIIGADLLASLLNFAPAPVAILTLFMLAPNPATAGIYYVTHRIARERRVYFSDFIQGLKRYFFKSLLLLFANLLISALLLTNILFYTLQPPTPILRYTAIIWLYGLFLWVEMQLYGLPLLIEQSNKSILLVLRNAVLLVMSDPLYTTILLVLLLGMSLLSSLLGLTTFFLICSLVSMVTNKALVERLREIRGEEEEEEIV